MAAGNNGQGNSRFRKLCHEAKSEAAVRAILVACMIAALISTFSSFGFSYFWWDDFNNFYLIQPSSAWTILWHVINPLALDSLAAAFRPAGMLIYRIQWLLFDLSPVPYRIFQWSLHTANVLLVYLLLRDLLRSRYAASFGAMLFSYQAVFFELYWNFWGIFEMLAALLMFLGLRLYIRHRDSTAGILAASAVYFVANQAKEMAITLPAIWLLYDLTVGKLWDLAPGLWNKTRRSEATSELWNTAKRFVVPTVILLIFAYVKTRAFTRMAALVSVPYNSSFAWYRNYSPVVIAEGYAWYFNAIFHLHFHSSLWMAAALGSCALMLFYRARTALFFLGYVFISFLPSVILSNHRFAYYWYIPSFGMIGLAALAVKRAADQMTMLLSARAAAVAGAAIFAVACAGNFFMQHSLDRFPRAWASDMAAEYRTFMEGLRSLPSPSHGETVYFKSVPKYFDEVSTKSAAQVAFRMTDINTRIVQDFPPDSKYRVRFENRVVTRETDAATNN